MMMHQIIDDRSLRNDPLINGLFVPPTEARFTWPATGPRETGTETGGMATGGLETGGMAVAELGAVETTPGTKRPVGIQNLREGYGFITPDEGGENLFFYWRAVVNTDFNQLQIGDAVSYDVGSNDRGPCAVNVRRLSRCAPLRARPAEQARAVPRKAGSPASLQGATLQASSASAGRVTRSALLRYHYSLPDGGEQIPA